MSGREVDCGQGDYDRFADAGRRCDTEAAVVQVIRDLGRPLSPQEVLVELQTRGVLTRGAYAVRGALSTLAKRGDINRIGHGRHTKYAAKGDTAS